MKLQKKRVCEWWGPEGLFIEKDYLFPGVLVILFLDLMSIIGVCEDSSSCDIV